MQAVPGFAALLSFLSVSPTPCLSGLEGSLTLQCGMFWKSGLSLKGYRILLDQVWLLNCLYMKKITATPIIYILSIGAFVLLWQSGVLVTKTTSFPLLKKLLSPHLHDPAHLTKFQFLSLGIKTSYNVMIPSSLTWFNDIIESCYLRTPQALAQRRWSNGDSLLQCILIYCIYRTLWWIIFPTHFCIPISSSYPVNIF